MAKPPDRVDATGAWSHGSIAPLTGAFGTTGNAIVDVTATPTQTLINNNFRVLEDKLNEIVAMMKDSGTIS